MSDVINTEDVIKWLKTNPDLLAACIKADPQFLSKYPELRDNPEEKKKKPNKYHNRKVTIDGLTFDSGKEAARAADLIRLHLAKKIFALALQVPIPVSDDGALEPIIYVADFVYLDEHLNPVFEDVKSEATKTQTYKIKRKLFKQKFGKDITEI